jgi:N utilization substance protein A
MTLRLSDEARRYIRAFEEITDVPARDCVLEEREPRSGSDGSSGQRGGSTASKGTGAERSSASSRTGDARETTAGPSPGPRDDRAVFVLPPGYMADAIGPDGRTVADVEERLNRRVELVEDADRPGDFVANALRPAAVYGVTVREREPDPGSDDGDGGGAGGAGGANNGTDTERIAYAEVNAADLGAAIGSGGRNVEMAVELAGRHHDIDAIELVPDPDSCIESVADRTGVEPVDALFDAVDERLLVVVPSGTLAESVGEDGAHAEALGSELGWPVEFVEYAPDAAGLVANALAPADVANVTVSDAGVAYAEVPEGQRGLAIGRGGRHIRRARLLAARYHDLDDVELA